MASFDETLRAAVADFTEHGYDRAERLEYWTERLRRAAQDEEGSTIRQEALLRRGLEAVYKRLIDRGEIVSRHPGVERWTLQRIRPALRAEVDRRILASANLIKLNRRETIEQTLRRFQGFATSIPAGGSAAVSRRSAQTEIKKSLGSLSYRERRVLIDQGHKLSAALSEIVAQDTGAIAMIWHSHWRQRGYNYREDHKERDQHVYLLKSSWAREAGLVKPGPDGYYEDITKVGEEVYCRCFAQWIYNIRDLPADMITRKGQEKLEEVRRKMAS